jgi:amidase
MRKRLVQAWILPLAVLPFIQTVAMSQTQTNESLTGEWQLTTVEMGIPWTQRLLLANSDGDIQGSVTGGKAVKGSIKRGEVRLEFTKGSDDKVYAVYVGRVTDTGMSGTYSVDGHIEGPWSAKRMPNDKPASPRILDFNPSQFYRQLSADVTPALRVWPGDTVRTKSVDAGGEDEKSVKRVEGGNPLTGPFYIEGAMPGDVLAITIKKLRVNRNWAGSDSGLVDRAVTTDYASESKREWKNTRWHLDADKQIAVLENGPDHLKTFSVPIHPMLGCVAVAPSAWDSPVDTRDSGDLGGNMDFNEIREGSTVFLPVRQPGALLYLGDAHAVQGDGELNGNALETSMDIEFSVDVQRDKNIGSPRVESNEYLMAVGLSGSLDDALRVATSELASWLRTDYHLTREEVAIVLGTSIEYKIAEVADRNAGVVAKIRKSSLASLSRNQ